VSRNSFPALALQALRGRQRWSRALRIDPPKPTYDAVIIGGGGHGLATAYFLAKSHGMRRIAVL
jgi:sarcosine oxidase subunit beta